MWLESLLESVEVNVSLSEAFIMLVVSFITGFIISITYMKTTPQVKCHKNYVLTMIFLPAIISSIILLIGSNVARAFSLAGAFSIIRFRSEPGEPKDIAYVLFAMGAGLAAGIGEYVFSFLFTIILCLVMILVTKTKVLGKEKENRQLKITIPEDMNYENELKEVFIKHSVAYKLTKVKTTALGSLYQIYYEVDFESTLDTQEFLNDLRIRNSNLDISLNMVSER